MVATCIMEQAGLHQANVGLIDQSRERAEI
jgi:hypothetical protein